MSLEAPDYRLGDILFVKIVLECLKGGLTLSHWSSLCFTHQTECYEIVEGERLGSEAGVKGQGILPTNSREGEQRGQSLEFVRRITHGLECLVD